MSTPHTIPLPWQRGFTCSSFSRTAQCFSLDGIATPTPRHEPKHRLTDKIALWFCMLYCLHVSTPQEYICHKETGSRHESYRNADSLSPSSALSLSLSIPFLILPCHAFFMCAIFGYSILVSMSLFFHLHYGLAHPPATSTHSAKQLPSLPSTSTMSVSQRQRQPTPFSLGGSQCSQ